ncbi:MAG: hypothetical protein HUJ56_07685 [Erysipelotrichaceae bacterium]|nr:hypothetical protein [Erysipelotrichaceae bacterium]
MVIEKIYFDMDGVLADFDRGCYELAGIKPYDQLNGKRDEKALFWKSIQKVDHFFDKLEPKDKALDMFRLLNEKYPGCCEILSAIPGEDRGILYAKEDKINWIKKYLGEEVVVHIVYRKEKINYAKGEGSILIDDYERSIDEWNTRGTGILHRSVEETLAKFNELEER